MDGERDGLRDGMEGWKERWGEGMEGERNRGKQGGKDK